MIARHYTNNAHAIMHQNTPLINQAIRRAINTARRKLGNSCAIQKDIRVTNIDYNMKNTTNTNSPLLNKVYTNLIDYVSEIQQEESTNKPTWITNFIAQCEQGENDFASIYKSLKDGLISQFGFEMTHHLIIPEIVWANNLDEFCE